MQRFSAIAFRPVVSHKYLIVVGTQKITYYNLETDSFDLKTSIQKGPIQGVASNDYAVAIMTNEEILIYPTRDECTSIPIKSLKVDES